MAYKVTKQVYMVEKRTKDGLLDFSEPQPPFLMADENKLCQYWMRMNPVGPVASWLEIRDVWYPSQGFYCRPKTW
jgi:hypothetical protein